MQPACLATDSSHNIATALEEKFLKMCAILSWNLSMLALLPRCLPACLLLNVVLQLGREESAQRKEGAHRYPH